MSGTQRLPIPPIPVMPDTGPVPLQRQPTAAENAEMSPTAMIQNYLAQRGYQPTAENVSRAMQANARDPGVISGLRSDTASPNPVGGAGGGRSPNTPVNAINTSLGPNEIPPPGYTGSGNTPVNIANTSLGPGEVQPGAGGGGLGILGPLGALISAAGGGYGLKRIIDALGGGAPTTPAPAAQPTADNVGTASKPTEKTTSAPPENPQEAAMRKATDGSPVEGVKPADPAKVGGRAQGPTTPTAGAEVPQMPPLRGAQPPPQVPPTMQPGVARTQALRPRIPIRPPIRVPF